MGNIKNLTLAIIFFFTGTNLFISGQEISIFSYDKSVLVYDSVRGYTEQIVIIGITSADDYIFPIYFDQDLEDISDLKVYSGNGRRFKQVKEPVVKDISLDINFMSSKWVKQILLEPESVFKITYRVTCKELMYFSGIPLFSMMQIDTAHYRIRVPSGYHFKYDIINKDTLGFVAIDTTKQEDYEVLILKTTPVKSTPDFLALIGIYKNIKLPVLRTIVVPEKYAGKEPEYLNDWYLSKAEPNNRLNEITKHSIDSLTAGISEPMELTEAIYNYIRNSFKYLDVEIGIGAFIPHDVNQTYYNKHGDCKDLSSLLCQLLNYKGIKADVALAATFNYICNCDFPALISANHEICVAYINNDTVVLDPTAPSHIIKYPVESLQDRDIFITGERGGYFYRVNACGLDANALKYKIDLKMADQELKGSFQTSYAGLSGYLLRSMYHTTSIKEWQNSVLQYYKDVFENQSVFNVKVAFSDTLVLVSGDLNIKGKLMTDNTNLIYLFVDFMPNLFETENMHTINDETFLGATINKKVEMTIETDKPLVFVNFNKLAINNEISSLLLDAYKISDAAIKIEYHFTHDDIWIKKDDLKRTNNILDTYYEKVNKPIFLK